MRPLEILIPILLSLSLVWPPGARWIAALALVVLVTHLIIEKYRWQMIPLYMLSGIVFFSALRDWNRYPTPDFWGTLFGRIVLPLMLLAVATALPWLMPVPQTPAPTGPHRVGTVTRVLVDESRRELYSGTEEPRRFVIQIWYPASPAPGAKVAPWMPDAKRLGRLISAWIKMPPFFLDHASLVRSHSYPDAPLDRSGGPYPVLVFSHGWGGFRAQNSYQTQELASHGYVVVGMEHPYGAMVTVFPDGRIARNHPAALPYNDPKPVYLPVARQLADQWARDIGFALDFLASLNGDDPQRNFTGALEIERVGVLGHSTGAGAALQFAGTDRRAAAGFAEDVYLAPVSQDVLESGLSQPLAFMFSEVWADHEESENNQTFRALETRLRGPHYAMHIRGSNHYDFTDLPALSPLSHALGLKGPIRGRRVHRIVNDYSLAFFNTYIKGQPDLLLAGPSSEYPEVIFRRLGEQPDHASGHDSPEEQHKHIRTDDEQDREGHRSDGAAHAKTVSMPQRHDQDREAPQDRD